MKEPGAKRKAQENALLNEHLRKRQPLQDAIVAIYGDDRGPEWCDAYLGWVVGAFVVLSRKAQVLAQTSHRYAETLSRSEHAVRQAHVMATGADFERTAFLQFAERMFGRDAADALVVIAVDIIADMSDVELPDELFEESLAT